MVKAWWQLIFGSILITKPFTTVSPTKFFSTTRKNTAPITMLEVSEFQTTQITRNVTNTIAFKTVSMPKTDNGTIHRV